MERIRAFLAAARTNGGALLVTGEPGLGKTGLLNALRGPSLTASYLRTIGKEGDRPHS